MTRRRCASGYSPSGAEESERFLDDLDLPGVEPEQAAGVAAVEDDPMGEDRPVGEALHVLGTGRAVSDRAIRRGQRGGPVAGTVLEALAEQLDRQRVYLRRQLRLAPREDARESLVRNEAPAAGCALVQRHARVADLDERLAARRAGTRARGWRVDLLQEAIDLRMLPGRRCEPRLARRHRRERPEPRQRDKLGRGVRPMPDRVL